MTPQEPLETLPMEPIEITPRVIVNESGGSGYTYIGKTSRHSIAYLATRETITYALGGAITTKHLLAQWGAGQLVGFASIYIVSAIEPTKYSKVYVSSIKESSPYQASVNFKYYWYEDSKYNTWKAETKRTQILSCSNYTPYCWKK